MCVYIELAFTLTASPVQMYGNAHSQHDDPMHVFGVESPLRAVLLQGNVLFVRFYEGPGSGMDRQGPPLKDERQRLKLAAENLVDLPILMGAMQQAIKQSVSQNMKKQSEAK